MQCHTPQTVWEFFGCLLTEQLPERQENKVAKNPGKINTPYLRLLRERPTRDESQNERSFCRTVECRLQKQQYNCTHHHPHCAYVLATPKTIWRRVTHNKINKKRKLPPRKSNNFPRQNTLFFARATGCVRERKRAWREQRRASVKRKAQQKQEAINDKYTQQKRSRLCEKKFHPV